MRSFRLLLCISFLAGCGDPVDDSTAISVAENDVPCGNGVREASEQCDDGNQVNLDGCDVTCRFEQIHRVNQLKLQSGTNAFCTANALGGSISSLARGLLQSSLDSAVKNGSVSLLVQLIGLEDLTGSDAPTLTVGTLNGTPVATTGYDGSQDRDGWYTAVAADLDADRNPIALFPGAIGNHVLSAGPGSLSVNLVFAGTIAPLVASGVMLRMPLDGSSAPAGHLASENLDPALVSFASAGTVGGPAGEMCGNFSAASLAAAPMPPVALSNCSNFDASHHLLDLLVAGCKKTILFVPITIVTPTQPDTIDPAAPGTGTSYHLSTDATRHVNGCTDQTGAAVDLDTCLGRAAYSSFYRLTTERVIVRP